MARTIAPLPRERLPIRPGAIIVGADVSLTEAATGMSTTGTTNRNGIYNSRLTGRHLHADDQSLRLQRLQTDGNCPYRSSGSTGQRPHDGRLRHTNSNRDRRRASSGYGDIHRSDDDGTDGDTGSASQCIWSEDSLNLMIAVTPGVTGNNGSNQDFVAFAGAQALTNSVYLNGVESTSGLQGNLATPSRDALQEIQVMTNVTDAEFGTGSTEMFQIKSGTNQFHGSAFEILQNEDLNANTWSNKYFQSQCAPSNASCIRQYARALDRFNDYGGSAGGPLWRNRAFIFGSYEYYNSSDDNLVPNSQTVPTPQMLTGDFSQLLTGGTYQGVIAGSNNPCIGQPYQYGQIFDPATQRVVNGVTCATPFTGNIIPASRLSSTALSVAKIYQQYYAPTISTRIYNNFPTMLAGTSQTAAGSSPSQSKRSYDFKYDQTLSPRQHFSASFDRATWHGLGLNGGMNYIYGRAPTLYKTSPALRIRRWTAIPSDPTC